MTTQTEQQAQAAKLDTRGAAAASRAPARIALARTAADPGGGLHPNQHEERSASARRL